MENVHTPIYVAYTGVGVELKQYRWTTECNGYKELEPVDKP